MVEVTRALASSLSGYGIYFSSLALSVLSHERKNPHQVTWGPCTSERFVANGPTVGCENSGCLCEDAALAVHKWLV
jgi:hypothetical protein